MTETDTLPSRDDELIDRMVDGPLSPSELRVAIDRLDRLPDGWKRCAAAFLEAQCWGESFRAMGEPASLPSQSQTLSFPGSGAPARTMAPRWVRHPVAAAVVAASFAIGWMSHGARPRTATDPTTPDLTTAGLSQPPDNSKPAFVTTNPALATAPVEPAEQPEFDNQFPINPAELVRTVGQLRIGDEGAGTEVPILAGPGITAEWLEHQPLPITEHGQVVLERHGYQVDQSRRLVTAVTADGRRVTVPIDQVQIRYTGNQSL